MHCLVFGSSVQFGKDNDTKTQQPTAKWHTFSINSIWLRSHLKYSTSKMTNNNLKYSTSSAEVFVGISVSRLRHRRNLRMMIHSYVTSCMYMYPVTPKPCYKSKYW